MTLAVSNARVLSLYPNSSGLCYAFFESELRPVDWGIKTARQRKHATLVGHAERLVKMFAPESIILPARTIMMKGSHRLQQITDAIAEISKSSDASVYWYSRVDIKACFSHLGGSTKDGIAATIARLWPEFEQHLPPVRRLWMSEDYRMGLFDAVALVLTYHRSSLS